MLNGCDELFTKEPSKKGTHKRRYQLHWQSYFMFPFDFLCHSISKYIWNCINFFFFLLILLIWCHKNGYEIVRDFNRCIFCCCCCCCWEICIKYRFSYPMWIQLNGTRSIHIQIVYSLEKKKNSTLFVCIKRFNRNLNRFENAISIEMCLFLFHVSVSKKKKAVIFSTKKENCK